MKKLFLLAGIFALMSITALNAQVTIGENRVPNIDAVLELTAPKGDKGFLPPKVKLETPHSPAPLKAHVAGMMVYNTTVLQDSLQAGLYVNNGTQWIAYKQSPYLTPTWFYMPSFPLKVSTAGTFNVDLWAEYNRQFDNAATGSVIVSSGAPAKPLSKVYTAKELNYYVTGYDNTVFSSVSLTSTGTLTYTITPAALTNVSDSTYMNIVFVVK